MNHVEGCACSKQALANCLLNPCYQLSCTIQSLTDLFHVGICLSCPNRHRFAHATAQPGIHRLLGILPFRPLRRQHLRPHQLRYLHGRHWRAPIRRIRAFRTIPGHFYEREYRPRRDAPALRCRRVPREPPPTSHVPRVREAERRRYRRGHGLGCTESARFAVLWVTVRGEYDDRGWKSEPLTNGIPCESRRRAG